MWPAGRKLPRPGLCHAFNNSLEKFDEKKIEIIVHSRAFALIYDFSKSDIFFRTLNRARKIMMLSSQITKKCEKMEPIL